MVSPRLLKVSQTDPNVVVVVGVGAVVPEERPSVRIEWKLRHVAADRGIWTGAQLRRLLEEKTGLQLSSASMSVLMATEPDKQPREVKIRTLAALCTALECTPNDLLNPVDDGFD